MRKTAEFRGFSWGTSLVLGCSGSGRFPARDALRGFSVVQAMAMRMAAMIVTAAPGQAEEVERCLGRVRGVRVFGVHRGVHVVLVAEAFDEEQLENLSRYIRGGFDGVEAVRTTIVRTDDACVPEQAAIGGARAAIEFLAPRGGAFGEERG